MDSNLHTSILYREDREGYMKTYLVLFLGLFLSINTFADDGDDRCRLLDHMTFVPQPSCDTSGEFALTDYSCETKYGHDGRCDLETDEISVWAYQYCEAGISGWNPFLVFVSYDGLPHYKSYCIYSESTAIDDNHSTSPVEEEEPHTPSMPDNEKENNSNDQKGSGGPDTVK